MSPVLWHAYFEQLTSDGVKVLLARYALQFVVVLKAKRDDMPKVAEAMWKRSRRRDET